MSATENGEHVKTLLKKENEYDASLRAMLISSGQINGAVLRAATELNLFDIIAQATPKGGYVSAAEIASKLPTLSASTPQRLDRMLRLLVTVSILSCSTRTNEDGSIERLYGLAPAGEYYVSNEGGPSWASIISFFSFHPYTREMFVNFKEIIFHASDDLSKIIHGKPAYQYHETDAKLEHSFHRAMAEISALHMKKILQIYAGFEGISTLVDVAGGIGQCLKMIISKYPSIKGINFDLPRVIQVAPPYPGIKFVRGDMFEGVPEGDAILLKGTTHNWSDEKCLQILSNCHQALKKGGKVIVIDLIKREEPDLTTTAKYVSVFDNVMFTQGGGMERTEKEFETLCKRSGFSRFHVACHPLSILGVMEFYK